MPSEVRLNIFRKKYKIRDLKFIAMLLNYTLGPPNLRVGGAVPPGPPGFTSGNKFTESFYRTTIIRNVFSRLTLIDRSFCNLSKELKLEF